MTSSRPWDPTGTPTHLHPPSVQIRIWARPSATKERHGDYALNVTGPILKFFSDHYATPYPLEKSGE